MALISFELQKLCSHHLRTHEQGPRQNEMRWVLMLDRDASIAWGSYFRSPPSAKPPSCVNSYIVGKELQSISVAAKHKQRDSSLDSNMWNVGCWRD